MKRINIAVDGHSSCGKSTTSKLLAKALGYKYIDTGAMYRAVTLYLMDHHCDWNAKNGLSDVLKQIKVDFKVNESGSRTLLNGKDVEDEIRSMRVSNNVSEVSTISAVRAKLVEQQQEIGREKGVVMDGRDIGTVVLPDAELKVFMTATLEARAKRRWDELHERGMKLSMDDVKANLEHRDRIDSTRADSPLTQATDAILLDTSDMTVEQQTRWLIAKAEEVIRS